MSLPALTFSSPPAPKTTEFFTPARRYQNQHFSPSSISFHYCPQTPSPLRTSRNANQMPPPPTPSGLSKSSPLANVENIWAANDENSPEPFTFPAVNPFTNLSKESAFARRSRESSPITDLSNRTSAARNRRKSLFLEQIRSRREDEKFEGRGEQVLRMDWVREKRAREERLARQAARWETNDIDMDEEEVGPSPTEEKEIEELVAYLESEQQHQQLEPQQHQRGDDAMSDDDDYDQLFMEVISANQDPDAHGKHRSGQHEQLAQLGQTEQPQLSGSHFEAGFDQSMDMS